MGVLSALQSYARAALWYDVFEDVRKLRIDPRKVGVFSRNQGRSQLQRFDAVFMRKRKLIVKAHLVLGLFSASCMSIVSTIAEGEIGSLHTIAASIGFGGASQCA